MLNPINDSNVRGLFQYAYTDDIIGSVTRIPRIVGVPHIAQIGHGQDLLPTA